MSQIKQVMMVQPESAGGNFEYALIPRQGMPFLSGALKLWNESGENAYLYDTRIWFEERSDKIDPERDLEGVDILMVTALINEAPRAYQIAYLAKQYHPNIVTIGGGPHMGPLPQEAIREGAFDVIVEREAEDIIGPLCDVLMGSRSSREQNLFSIPGVVFPQRIGGLYQTPRVGNKRVIDSDFVAMPDLEAIQDLSSSTPMMGGVLETVRGCTEKCTYCEVIQQFWSYRPVQPEIQLARIRQLQDLASRGLIHNTKGRFNVFISDDLHVPPLQATRYRDFRLARLKEWAGRTEGISFTCQVRSEVAEDDEILEAMQAAGIKMLYVGVESNDADNLAFVRKRQTPSQVDANLRKLRAWGFRIVAMTIIGLPYDTEEKIMAMADWVKGVSDFQTMNWLTPLPATSNWKDLKPLDAQGDVLPTDENGNVLPEFGLRPYHLYTGEQMVTYDDRWTLQETYEIGQRYYAKLEAVDSFYGKIFKRSIDLHAGQWGEGIASRFRDISPHFAERVHTALRKPSSAGIAELLWQVNEVVRESPNAQQAAEGLQLLRSFRKLFAYTA